MPKYQQILQESSKRRCTWWRANRLYSEWKSARANQGSCRVVGYWSGESDRNEFVGHGVVQSVIFDNVRFSSCNRYGSYYKPRELASIVYRMTSCHMVRLDCSRCATIRAVTTPITVNTQLSCAVCTPFSICSQVFKMGAWPRCCCESPRVDFSKIR